MRRCLLASFLIGASGYGAPHRNKKDCDYDSVFVDDVSPAAIQAACATANSRCGEICTRVIIAARKMGMPYDCFDASRQKEISDSPFAPCGIMLGPGCPQREIPEPPEDLEQKCETDFQACAEMCQQITPCEQPDCLTDSRCTRWSPCSLLSTRCKDVDIPTAPTDLKTICATRSDECGKACTVEGLASTCEGVCGFDGRCQSWAPCAIWLPSPCVTNSDCNMENGEWCGSCSPGGDTCCSGPCDVSTSKEHSCLTCSKPIGQPYTIGKDCTCLKPDTERDQA